MDSHKIVTVGDLMNFLVQYNPQTPVFLYNRETETENRILHIDVEHDKMVIYD